MPPYEYKIVRCNRPGAHTQLRSSEKGILFLFFTLTAPDSLRILLDVLSAGQSIERRRLRDNTDDVGLVSPKVGVDSPKRVRYYFDSKVTFRMSLCYLSRTYWIV